MLVFQRSTSQIGLTAMLNRGFVPIAVAVLCVSTLAQKTTDSSFKLALPDHNGQLRWVANGFNVVESSAKPNGQEIGIRGKDESGRLNFLGFLFLVPDQSKITSTKCRDGVLDSNQKN